MDWSTIGTIGVALAGAIAGGFIIKIVISGRTSRRTDTRIVSQKKNEAGGDIVAGDSTKTTIKQ
jgi:hypothetical protein